MPGKKEIIICLGSYCFARGNKDLMNIILKYLRQKNLSDKVSFRGDHCFDMCCDGPNLKIGSKIYHGVNKDNVIDFLIEGLKENS
jgi:NADH:ubiquinone oxidoreductase subunit E